MNPPSLLNSSSGFSPLGPSTIFNFLENQRGTYKTWSIFHLTQFPDLHFIPNIIFWLLWKSSLFLCRLFPCQDLGTGKGCWMGPTSPWAMLWPLPEQWAWPVQSSSIPGRLASEAQWNELSRAKLCACGFWKSHKGGVWPKACVIFQLCHVQHFICGVALYLFLQTVSPSEGGKVAVLAWLTHCGIRTMRTALTLANYGASKSDPAHLEGCSLVWVYFLTVLEDGNQQIPFYGGLWHGAEWPRNDLQGGGDERAYYLVLRQSDPLCIISEPSSSCANQREAHPGRMWGKRSQPSRGQDSLVSKELDWHFRGSSSTEQTKKPHSVCKSPQEMELQSLAYDKYRSFCQNISRWSPGPLFSKLPKWYFCSSPKRDSVTFFQMYWMWCFPLLQ